MYNQRELRTYYQTDKLSHSEIAEFCCNCHFAIVTREIWKNAVLKLFKIIISNAYSLLTHFEEK